MKSERQSIAGEKKQGTEETNWEKERWNYEEAKLFSQSSISLRMDGHCKQTTAATISLDEDVDDAKINPGLRCISPVKTHGSLPDDFQSFIFCSSLTVEMPHLASSLIAPEAESQCFRLQQWLKSTPTDLRGEGERLHLQLGPSQSGWRVQRNTHEKHTPVCT